MALYKLRTLVPTPHLAAADGREHLRLSKQLALLTYLASRPGGRASRDELIGLLWEDARPADARNALRQAVYQLRRATGPGIVEGEDTLILDRDSVDFDVTRFRAFLTEGCYAEAVDLYQAPFLGSGVLAGAREFEHWADGVRQQLAAEHRQALRLLVAQRVDRARWREAVGFARRLVDADPHDPDALIRLVEVLSLAGDPVQARVAADEAARVAADAQGGTLRAETAAAIRRALAPGGPDERRTQDGFPRHPEMVGRAEVFGRITERWKAAQEGRGGGILVAGEAGIGKTRLVLELDRWIRRGPGVVLTAACHAIDRADPFAPFLDLARAAAPLAGLAGASATSLEVLATLVPEIADRFRGSLVPRGLPLAPQAIAAALEDAFAAVADETPLAVIVEDLHWAPAATLRLAHGLARRFAHGRALLVLTSRDHAADPETTQALHDLSATGIVAEVLLEPLGYDDVADLLASMAELPPGPRAEAFVGRLAGHTDGVPFYVLEALKALFEAGVVGVRAGRWHLGALLDVHDAPLPLARSSVDILLGRLEPLGPCARQLAQALAVWGKAADMDALARLVRLPSAEVVTACEALERRRLVVRRGDTAALAHDEIADALRRGMRDDERLALHAAAAVVARVDADAGRSGEWAAAAWHAAMANDTSSAVELAARAAAAVEVVSGPEPARELVRRLAWSFPDLARSRLEAGLRPVLDGRWSARRWLAEHDGSAKSRRMRWAAALAGSVVVLTAAIWPVIRPKPAPPPLGGGFIALAGRRAQDNRLGAIEAYRLDSTFVLRPAPQESLPMAVRAGYPATQGGPGGRQVITECSLGDEDPVRGCVTDLATGQQRVVLRAMSDVHVDALLPDGAILARLGYYPSPTRYASLVALVDPSGRVVDTLSSGTDVLGSSQPVSSSGRVLVWTDGPRPHAIALSLDHDPPVTIPDCRGPVAAPRGREVVACRPSRPGVVTFTDLRTASLLAEVMLPDVVSEMLWSPDGTLLLVRAGSDSPGLFVVEPERGGAPRRVATLRPGLSLLGWAASPEPMPDSFALAELAIRLVPGASRPLSLRAFRDRREVSSASQPLRWVLDRDGIVRFRDGAVIGDRPGMVRAEARIGVTTVVSVDIEVSEGESRILLRDDFDIGLDTAIWKPFGHPMPTVLRAEGRGRSRGFHNSGDQSHESGVVARRQFDARRGLTVEFWARMPAERSPWQVLRVGLRDLPPDSFRAGQGSPVAGSGESNVAYAYVAPDERDARAMSVNVALGGAIGFRADRDWHRFRFVVYPSGEIAFFRDGVELGRGQAQADRLQLVTLELAGRSVGGLVMMDDVTVWEGVVLDPLPTRGPR